MYIEGLSITSNSKTRKDTTSLSFYIGFFFTMAILLFNFFGTIALAIDKTKSKSRKVAIGFCG